ncbi:MAG TPA: DUF4340 domain-containing protein [Burkholderiaceae bacterium]|jgi:hypothetical protein|nr:DUF4340 domain-containing protein [Burkholderiaceae bacterium]
MQRAIRILAVVLIVQIGAALALAWRGAGLSAAQPDAALIGADLKEIDRLRIDGPAGGDKPQAASVELVKRDGKWLLPGYFDAPADAAKVDDLLKRLAGAKRGLPVATSASALARFRVADQEYERRIVAARGETTLATVFLGTSSGVRKAHARTAQDQAVYAIELAAYEVRTAPADWLDQSLLMRDAAALAEIAVAAAGKPTLTLRRAQRKEGDQTSSTWEAESGQSVDQAKASALADAIVNLKVDAVLGKEPKPEWRLDQPDLRLTLKDTQGKTSQWSISKAKSGDIHVLKASDQSWYLEIKSWNARPLLEAAVPDKLLAAAAAKS